MSKHVLCLVLGARILLVPNVFEYVVWMNIIVCGHFEHTRRPPTNIPRGLGGE